MRVLHLRIVLLRVFHLRFDRFLHLRGFLFKKSSLESSSFESSSLESTLRLHFKGGFLSLVSALFALSLSLSLLSLSLCSLLSLSPSLFYLSSISSLSSLTWPLFCLEELPGTCAVAPMISRDCCSCVLNICSMSFVFFVAFYVHFLCIFGALLIPK